MRRALISVTDKAGVVEFARGLRELGFGILSTGGTRKALLEAGVDADAYAKLLAAGITCAGDATTPEQE